MKKTELKRKTPLRRGKKPERIPKGATVVVTTQKELDWLEDNPVAKKHLRRIPKGSTTLERLLGTGKVHRASTFTAKPKPMKKRSPSNAGWWFIALEIWDEREHVCEVCGVSLGDTPIPSMFSHLLPRGSYRRYKLYKPNIILKCPPCHDRWHKEGTKNLVHIPEWRKVCSTYYALRDQANEVDV